MARSFALRHFGSVPLRVSLEGLAPCTFLRCSLYGLGRAARLSPCLHSRCALRLERLEYPCCLGVQARACNDECRAPAVLAPAHAAHQVAACRGERSDNGAAPIRRGAVRGSHSLSICGVYTRAVLQQCLHKRHISRARCEGERRGAIAVGRVHGCAELDQRDRRRSVQPRRLMRAR